MKRGLGAVSILLTAICLLCWVVMFLAATDVWHDTGSRDFWHLQGPPYADLRACIFAFYVLFAVLIGSLVLQVASTLRRATR